MKKNILIFSHALEIGGAERALIGLLETIDTEKNDVDLFLMRHSGELMKYIPEYIHLLPESPQYTCLAVPFTTVIKKRQFGMAVGRILGKVAAKWRIKKLRLSSDNDVELQCSHKYTLPFVPQISDKEYDLAISFLTPHYFIADRVKAKTKLAWIHTDYTVVSVDRKEQLKMWSNYDGIVSISENVTKTFLKIFPELRHNILLIPNIMPLKYMCDLAKEFDSVTEMPNDGSIKLLSIGRFSSQKNFENVPEICKLLREKGINAKWYLIGFGATEDLIRQKIAETKMQDYVIILGKKENPYPYITGCDIYVQPSRYEGKCVAVTEAQILHKPVVITAYPTSSSQLKDGYDGVIVPMDNNGCALGISKVIQNKKLQEALIENTYKEDYSNTAGIVKLYQLMEE